MVKATGRTDLEYKGMYLRKPPKDAEVRARPYIEISGERNTQIFEELKIGKIHSSISHEEDYAVAFITLCEAE
jgi:phosphopantetheinyl transferase (holo-ACP synthase)